MTIPGLVREIRRLPNGSRGNHLNSPLLLIRTLVTKNAGSPQPSSRSGRKGFRGGTIVLAALLAAAVGGVSGGLVDRSLTKK
ncbi:trypsin-like serine protease [Cutibacterium acnes JCM 18918]|nr:trypsin-like serine protease [Cutibacterium acnes JCM 18918]